MDRSLYLAAISLRGQPKSDQVQDMQHGFLLLDSVAHVAGILIMTSTPMGVGNSGGRTDGILHRHCTLMIFVYSAPSPQFVSSVSSRGSSMTRPASQTLEFPSP